ncbi:MAG TPA: TetR/AcrR family transcriptional regulator [Deltaproteobacteria bacterium]|nr:TetR/AcrR family transcriptional regulator [Deltaproteobacteria bacterium]
MARKQVQAQRKMQILKALDSCLQEKSFQQTSIKDIARVAGVNHGVLHYYFASKEDILLNYIDYVIEDYRDQIREWLGTKDISLLDKRGFIEEIFAFINNKITLNRNLSRIFIEIWEIGVYNDAVRQKLKHMYSAWIRELTSYLSRFVPDEKFAMNISVSMVGFWEGMALFSTIFDEDSLDIAEVLGRFQERILEIL